MYANLQVTTEHILCKLRVLVSRKMFQIYIQRVEHSKRRACWMYPFQNQLVKTCRPK